MSTTPTPQPDDSSAPSVPMTSAPPSTLGAVVSGSGSNPVMPRYDNSDERQTDADTAVPYTPGNRLASVLSTIGKAMATGLSAIPDRGAPSFVTGLGQGARAQQAAQQQEQDIKFKTFDDQIRAAQLHNQDMHQQNLNQEQQDAHEDHMAKMHANDGDWGIEYDSVPNNGEAVADHLRTQTAATGAASVPPGTHISGDGNNILIPKNTPETQAGQLAQFKAIAPALGINVTIPNGATKLDSSLATVFYNKLQGFSPTGEPYTAEKLPSLIASNQSRLADLKKQGAPQVQIDAISGIIAKQQAHLKADNDAMNAAANAASKRKIAEQNAISDNKAGNTEDINAAKAQNKGDNTELNSVAFDPNYQNPDGSKGANVVMSKADAAAKGLQHYKADPQKLNATIAGFNDVQNKLNQLADVVTDPKRMGAVIPQVAADMLRHGHGIELGAFGTKIDTSTIDADLARTDALMANQATKDYVTAMLGAHEALTQLPRLQTFGQSSRMTQQQMEASQRLLPQPGDTADLANQKMTSLQGMLDPLRKQVPKMPGAETIPSWREKQQAQTKQQTPSRMNAGQQSNLANFVSGLK